MIHHNMQTNVAHCSWFCLRPLKDTEKVIHTLLLTVRPPQLEIGLVLCKMFMQQN